MTDLQIGLDYVADDTRTGYRLERLEVLNWGTFDKQVWMLRPKGQTGLLTGDIGTGKSTLVDAITSLLIPPSKIRYNKAAGAGSRERTLRSYVLGYYKVARSDFEDSSARPVALRSETSYSVVLGVFKNEAYMQTVTLAQVLWTPTATGQPKYFYAAAERELSIAEDFAHFGGEVNQLRRALRRKQIEIWERFPAYGAWFRRRFGIHHEQALDLFHQTVSMKSVGNLTNFVRSHMLEPFNAARRIEKLISHFDALDAAHEAVLRAKHQIEKLKPLVGQCDRHDELEVEIGVLERCQHAAAPYFAALRVEFLGQDLAALRRQEAQIAARILRFNERLQRLDDKLSALRRDIELSGGARLSELEIEIRDRDRERLRCKEASKAYAEQLGIIGERLPDDSDSFIAQREKLVQLADRLRADREASQIEHTELSVAEHEQLQEHNALEAEIASLKQRVTNIPAAQIELRRKLCGTLDLDEASMPFAGELLRVREEAAEWEGAAERLLRRFGLSLLVEDSQYQRVAEWVDQNYLRGRLVYFRTRERRAPMPELHRDSLVHRLAIKPDSPFYSWLSLEVALRFDVACCATQDQFRQEARAITRAGQIKQVGERHEKDDRCRIDDRARYVLGWQNEEKINALQSRARVLGTRIDEIRAKIAKLRSERDGLNRQIDALSKLESYPGFEAIDWRTPTRELAALTREKTKLESESDRLRELRSEEAEAKASQTEAIAKRDQAVGQKGSISTKIEQSGAARDRAKVTLDAYAPDEYEGYSDRLDQLRSQVSRSKITNVDSYNEIERSVVGLLQREIRDKNQQLANVRASVSRLMTEFSREYVQETDEFDTTIESAREYRDMLQRLREDGLPTFEKDFKMLLNENTIREVANFQSLLDRERQTIRDRIGRINESLAEIEYNRDRYIRLETHPSPDEEIREFRRQLERCTEGSLGGAEDDQYSERKFREVKKVIDRLRGREQQSEMDRRWTAKVTDVRNWFEFAASERRCEDHREYEHYSDSGGKSGGQKEKLAYTILAASLAYQFGLECASVPSRSFRFVVIDEAFGRGSDESAKFALTLFAKLHLQLLIVTPLQKTRVIEPFVKSVAFVNIENDQRSRLLNMSIEEYREEKRRRSAANRSE